MLQIFPSPRFALPLPRGEAKHYSYYWRNDGVSLWARGRAEAIQDIPEW